MTYKKPHGYKLKNKMTNISKVSYVNTPIKLLSTRSYILYTLKHIYTLITLSPGLISPKFPLILALCSLGKYTCISYFIHIHSSNSNIHNIYTNKIPKEYSKLYKPDYTTNTATNTTTSNNNTNNTYICPIIQDILQLLINISQYIQLYKCIIISYYYEYILINDMPVLSAICPEVTLKFPGIEKYTGPIFMVCTYSS